MIGSMAFRRRSSRLIVGEVMPRVGLPDRRLRLRWFFNPGP